MKRRAARPGYGILEIMVGAAISSLILLGAFKMLSSATGSWDRSTSQTCANGGAAFAMQRIIADLREAQSFTIEEPGPDTGSRLVITYPVADAQGSYEAGVADPDADHQVTYFVQNRSLWRLKPSELADPLPVCRGENDEFTVGEDPREPSTWTNESGVDALEFESSAPGSLTITVRTRMNARVPTPDPQTGELVRAPLLSELTERVVLLRNR